MKQRVRQLTALILALAMCLSLFSANVWAAEIEPLEDGSMPAQSIEEVAVEEVSEPEDVLTEETTEPKEEPAKEDIPAQEPDARPKKSSDECELTGEAETDANTEENASEEESSLTTQGVIASGSCGDEFSWKIENGKLIISNTDSIGKWFHYKDAYGLDFSESSISKIVLSNGIEVVYTEAFHGLSNIKSVQLPSTLQSIGKYAFEGCSITDIVIPSSVTLIRDGAFKECKKLTKIYFTGDAPQIEANAFEGVTATAYYPAGNKTWTSRKKQNYGGHITWKEYTSVPAEKEKGYFRIPEDTNSFSNTISNFFQGKYFTQEELDKEFKLDPSHFLPIIWALTSPRKVKILNPADDYDNDGETEEYYVVNKTAEPNLFTYHTSAAYFDRLTSGLDKSEIGKIQNKMNKEWGGACHGIAVSMALVSQGELKSEAGITGDYNSFDKPKNDHSLRDMIHFYQLSQYVPRGRETITAYNPSVNNREDGVSLHDFLDQFVRSAVQASKDGKPFVFSFGDHSIVAYGGSETKDGIYSIQLYDENQTGRPLKPMIIDCNRDTFSFTDGNGDSINQSNYTDLSYTGPERLYGVLSTLSAQSSDSKPVISVTANKRFKIINNRGKTLTFSNGSYAGTMTVFDSWMTGEGENREINFEVDPFDTLTMTDFDETIELEAEIDGDYYSAEVNGASRVVLSSQRIDISGSDFAFTGGTTAGLEQSDLAQVSASAEGDVTIRSEDKKIVVDSQKSLYETEVSAYDNTSSQTKEIEDSTGRVEIAEGENGQISVETDQKQISLNDCVFSISTEVQVYDGTHKTPEIIGSYGSKKLILGQDFKLSYSNNLHIGIATATITGIGNYTGTRHLTFEIIQGDDDDDDDNRPRNTISVPQYIFYTANPKKNQTVHLEASARGGARLSYMSNQKKVTVTKNGKVTIKKGFAGVAIITIVSEETSDYLPEAAKVAVYVFPSPVKITSVKAKKHGFTTVKWKKNVTATGYQLQCSKNKRFKKSVKTWTIKGKKKTAATIQFSKKGTYYLRIRTVNGKLRSGWSKVKALKITK